MELILKKKMNFKNLFLDHCRKKKLEINDNQIFIIESISKFYNDNFNYKFFSHLFSKKKKDSRFLFTG